MSSPLVTVVIPAYNGTDHIGEAIQSVLDQTYPHFELIVVDDASPDNTAEVVKGFQDPRLRYIRHERNRLANAARNTGIRAAKGEVIAFLDQDDMFHPEKLRVHVEYLRGHPDVGMTYNARFELNYSARTIRSIYRPPQAVELSDLVLGFPMSPSDMVITRDWLFRVGLWDEGHDFHGGEIILTGRLYLAGCRFANVGRVLNYRRHHSGRVYRDVSRNCKSELAAQEKILSEPRCPPEVLALRDTAYMNTYLVWGYEALAQDETTLGQEYIREAIRLKPSIIEGKPCPLVEFITAHSVSDESQDHRILLHRLFSQLPPELVQLSGQYRWAVAHGYLIRGARAVMWDRPEDGRLHFAQATEFGAKIDELFVQKLTYQLLSYEMEFGSAATQELLRNLAPHLEKVGGRSEVRWLNGCYWVNRAFQSYQTGEHDKVPSQVLRAVASDPKYLANRGVLSILLRSMVGR
jgi:glycosyltransferase involved in cell wall biosynthesis